MIRHVAGIAVKTSPIDLDLAHVFAGRDHRTGMALIFLGPDGEARDVRTLYRRLNSGPWSVDPAAPPFEPHITLGRGADRVVADAITRLQGERRRIPARIERLTLMAVEGQQISEVSEHTLTAGSA